ncbi:MAG: ATP-binding cassette domain-containing protein [Treponema sp.]|nr:ATP-binding cassette domain-containing protein [Treponema sp.]
MIPVRRDIISLKDIYYSWPRQKKWALENICLDIKEGEFLAVMGENGAGKTTLCMLFNGIIPHSAGGRLLGTVTVDGEDTAVTPVPRLALKVGMVLDDPDTQLFTSSVRHEAAFGPENQLLPADEIEKRVKQALSAAGLGGFEDRLPSTLSGGEKQRLAIAAALAMRGKILVLDEPLSRLDAQGAADVMSLIGEIRRKYQITVIMAAGESNVIAQSADRVCVLQNGRIAALDTPEKIFANNELPEKYGMEPLYTDVKPQNETLNVRGDSRAALAPVIEIRDFCYSYDQRCPSVENINLSVNENDFAAIVGRNGCGKTTLLKGITGLLRPSAGDILIRGKNTKELPVSSISREIGFVMQNPDNQLFTDSVYKEAAFALRNMRRTDAALSGTEIKSRVQDALKTVGLNDADSFPHGLNRADRTRVVLASVIAMGCRIILLDEIDVGQDYRGMRQIMNIAADLHKRGFTIVFVTHNMSLVYEYARRVITMEKNGTHEK